MSNIGEALALALLNREQTGKRKRNDEDPIDGFWKITKLMKKIKEVEKELKKEEEAKKKKAGDVNVVQLAILFTAMAFLLGPVLEWAYSALHAATVTNWNIH
jgi:hypothetical protein